MALPHELECRPQMRKAFRTKRMNRGCSPAGGTNAAFDFTERRHVPLAALGKATPVAAVRERGRDAFAAPGQPLEADAILLYSPP